MANFDSPWKEALDEYLELFMAFCFPAIHAQIDWARGYESLEKELQEIAPASEAGSRFVDKLFKVWRIDGREEWVLIHIDVQSQKEPEFPRRMYVYNYRLTDRYNRAVVSLAVLGDEHPGWRPDHYQRSLWDCRVEFHFPVVKLLDWAGREEELAASGNPFALFVLAHLKAVQTRRDEQGRYRWKLQLIRNLFDAGLKGPDIRKLFRFIDWLMDLPPGLDQRLRHEVYQIQKERKMPFVTSFERLAKEEGRDEGRQEGRDEGRQEGEYIGRIHTCERLLNRALTPSDDLVRLSLDELQRRAEAIEAEVQARDGTEKGEYIGRIHAYEQLLNQALTPRDDLLQLSVEQLGHRADELQAELRSR